MKADSIFYFDNNSTTAPCKEVLEAMDQLYALGPLNPSSHHRLGKKAKLLLDEARETIATFFRVSKQNVSFVSSATEALNQLISPLLTKSIVSTKVEHPAISELLHKARCCYTLNSTEDTYIDYDELEKLFQTQEIEVAIFSGVNSQTGHLANLEQLSKLCLNYGVRLIIDAVALIGKNKLPMIYGEYALVFSGHKIHGPLGTACIITSENYPLEPLLLGGGQERGLRSSTHNLPSIVGCAKAIEIIKNMTHLEESLTEIRDSFETWIQREIPDCRIVGKNAPRVSNLSCVSFPEVDSDLLLMLLDDHGVIVSKGSACASGSTKVSEVLYHFGLHPKIAQNALRFSFSRDTTLTEIERAVYLIRDAYFSIARYAKV